MRAINRLEVLLEILGCVEFNETEAPRNDNLVELDITDTKKCLKNCIQDIILHIKLLGMFGGRIALAVHIIELEKINCHVSEKLLIICINCIITTLQNCKRDFDQELKRSENKLLGYLSPKVKLLLNVLRGYKQTQQKEFLGIIFVTRRSTAKILYHILKEYINLNSDLAFIKPEFIVGSNNNPNNITRASMYKNKTNRKVLDSFVNEDINLLIATTVIEEGVDIPHCTFVCKFDHPKDYRSYIQSKGRARNKESLYYIFLGCDDYEKFQQNYMEYVETEKFLNEV